MMETLTRPIKINVGAQLLDGREQQGIVWYYPECIDHLFIPDPTATHFSVECRLGLVLSVSGGKLTELGLELYSSLASAPFSCLGASAQTYRISSDQPNHRLCAQAIEQWSLVGPDERQAMIDAHTQVFRHFFGEIVLDEAPARA